MARVLKQLNTGSWASAWRVIAVLLLVGGMIFLWQTLARSRFTTNGETLSVHAVSLPTADRMVVGIANNGADPVTVAQVQVDAAYWNFAIEPSTLLAPAGRATITIPYHWVPNDLHRITIVTSSGATFEGDIATPPR